MSPRDAVDEFLFDHTYSPRTLEWHTRMLGRFADHLTSLGVADTGDIVPAHLRSFLETVRALHNPRTDTPVGSHTVHAYARSLRTFIRWCAESRLMDEGLPRRLKMPKLETATVIASFTPDQVERLMRAADKSAYPLRNRALLAVLLDTGCRASEVVGLTLDRVHFDPEGAWLFVHGKGDKWREVGLGQKGRNLLHRYIHRERGTAVAPWAETFLGRRGPLTRSGLDQTLYDLRDGAGPQHFQGVRVSAHTFRHTYAQSYLEKGGDVYMLSRTLGHTSVAVTEIYLRSLSSRVARRGPSVFDQF